MCGHASCIQEGMIRHVSPITSQYESHFFSRSSSHMLRLRETVYHGI